jgi:hypothetical protein
LKPYKVDEPEDEHLVYRGIWCNIARIQDIIILVFKKENVTRDFYVRYVSIPSNAKEASEYMSKMSDSLYYFDFNNHIRDNNNSIISICS